ncbi:M23 family metallopeptidase [Paenibacillus naphthalenovorans]|uniref:M23 family metallopeptidase n=1 Tax=Paenibacillus naphthalenovorans TaxID=162209 RepID=UPI000881E3FA|nr:M23 family metallopeptidase [Paenibacillus naphthalenovorans]SDH82972.1 Murein DD-endopeptidase MepM and murein hydrolase activator NlpD, contain LysM domain [Paenibacillus naphthalenovorans]
MKNRTSAMGKTLAFIQWFTAFAVIIAVVISGRWFVKAHSIVLYDVFLDDQWVGTVSDTDKIRRWKADRYEEAGQRYSFYRFTSNLDRLRFEESTTRRDVIDLDAVLAALKEKIMFTYYAVEIRIEGRTAGIVKDPETAAAILEQVKAPYMASQKHKEASVLSAGQEGNTPEGRTTAEFVQRVELLETAVTPGKVEAYETVLNRIVTGDVQPMEYTVQPGDCISLIAQRYRIPSDLIRANNPGIKNDLIRIGQKLNLSVQQPWLSVVTRETRTEQVKVPSGVKYEKDSGLKSGVIQIVSNGKPGLKQVSYQIVRVNGELKEEKKIGEQLVEAPVQSIVRQGTKVIPGTGTGKFTLPVLRAKVTSEFGLRWGKNHKGTDFVSDERGILASDNGKVIFAGWKSGYGNCIIIDHGNGYETLYGHLSKLGVRQDETVKKGEKIGVMGSTGNSTGVHLHFEIIKNGRQQNPMKYFSL